MIRHPYAQLIRYKQWADRDLYEVTRRNFDRLPTNDATLVLRLLDHMQAVDSIFQHHLQGVPHNFKAPQSETLPDLPWLANSTRRVDDWYVAYAANLAPTDFDEPVDFAFTNGAPGRMTRGEIILHVCLHASYHRGNAGFILHKSGIKPNVDRMTDFLEMAA